MGTKKPVSYRPLPDPEGEEGMNYIRKWHSDWKALSDEDACRLRDRMNSWAWHMRFRQLQWGQIEFDPRLPGGLFLPLAFWINYKFKPDAYATVDQDDVWYVVIDKTAYIHNRDSEFIVDVTNAGRARPVLRVDGRVFRAREYTVQYDPETGTNRVLVAYDLD
jgi:hypothetical protein